MIGPVVATAQAEARSCSEFHPSLKLTSLAKSNRISDRLRPRRLLEPFGDFVAGVDEAAEFDPPRVPEKSPREHIVE